MNIYKSSKVNRNPVKSLFITFSQSKLVTKEEFFEVLVARYPMQYAKLCRETHKDGNPHIHAMLYFKDCKYSKGHMVKYLKEKYPNDYKRIDVGATRSVKNAIEYQSKEDKDPLVYGTPPMPRNPQLNWINKFARELGYRNRDHAVACIKVDQEEAKQERVRITNFITDFYLTYHVHPFEEKYLPWHLEESWNKFLCMQETRNDITNIKKYYNIKGSTP